MRDAIIGKTLEGIVDKLNQAAEKIFGFTADEMTGRSVSILLPAECQQEEQDFLSTVARGESIYHFESEPSERMVAVSMCPSPFHRSATCKIRLSVCR